MSIWCFN